MLHMPNHKKKKKRRNSSTGAFANTLSERRRSWLGVRWRRRRLVRRAVAGAAMRRREAHGPSGGLRRRVHLRQRQPVGAVRAPTAGRVLWGRTLLS